MHQERSVSGTPPRRSTCSSTSTPLFQERSRTLHGRRTARGLLLLGMDERSEYQRFSYCEKVLTHIQEIKAVMTHQKLLLVHEVTLIKVLWAQVNYLFLTRWHFGCSYITIIDYHHSWLQSVAQYMNLIHCTALLSNKETYSTLSAYQICWATTYGEKNTCIL